MPGLIRKIFGRRWHVFGTLEDEKYLDKYRWKRKVSQGKESHKHWQLSGNPVHTGYTAHGPRQLE